MVLAIPDVLQLTVIFIIVALILLIFPSLLAWWARIKAIDLADRLLTVSIDKGEGTAKLNEIANAAAASTDKEGIAASTRMTIATIALLVVGISLFCLMALTSQTEWLAASPETSANATAALTTFSAQLTQTVSIILGILGGVLSAAVGFYFGSQTQTSTQLAAKGLEDARSDVEKQIKAAEAAKIELEKIKQLLAPTANAGLDQTVNVNTLVTLDGTASSDPNNNLPLTYEWSIKSAPTGSSATLSSTTADKPTFTPDKAGDYEFALNVTNTLGLKCTAPDTVRITAT
jgi:hypothetical protein